MFKIGDKIKGIIGASSHIDGTIRANNGINLFQIITVGEPFENCVRVLLSNGTTTAFYDYTIELVKKRQRILIS